MIFLDTSAIYALADKADKNHERAKEIFQNLLHSREELLIHNYIIVESQALIQHRLGFLQARVFLHEAEQFTIIWVDLLLHNQAGEYFARHGKKNLSFVDCVSFILMHQEHIKQAFAFDADFTKAGFELLS